MKLVMNRYQVEEKCKICQKIDRKEAQIRKEEERIRRWRNGGKLSWSFASQQLKDESRVGEKEGKLKGIGEQAGSASNDVWDEIEKLKAKINELLEDRIRERSHAGIGGSGEDEPKGQAPKSTTLEGSLKSLRLHTSGETSPSNISDSPSQNRGNQVVASGNPSPASRIFPIDPAKDASLIFSWQEHVLPVIKPLLCDGQDTSLSMTLLRQGKTRDDSEPVVLIQTSKPRSEERQQEIIRCIEKHLFPLQSPRILFVVGLIKRTARRSDLDILPYTARNTAFLRRPPMGVSIGIEGSVKDTATLGGYIYIDGIIYILTVHHLFTDDDTCEVYKPGTAITQPSLQEVKELGEMWDPLKASGETFHRECVKKSFEDLKACLPEFSFGHLERSSGYRNRASRDGFTNIEMDWAICSVPASRVGAVFAIGRTSGHQNGNINSTTTCLFLQNDDGSYRESAEWAVLRPQSQGEEIWMRTRIGVSGYSGAWILEHGTDNLVGQVWGRDFQNGSGNDDTGEIITYHWDS
jgi:hypothetical protein